MTDEELENRFTQLVRTERRITLEILSLIREADERRHFLGRGFSNLFDWLVRGHGYSEPAARRRILAMRLIASVPEARELLSCGELNLSNLAQAQATFTERNQKPGTECRRK